MQVTAQLRGWRTGSGLLLSEPATASVDYTPALAKYAPQAPDSIPQCITPLQASASAVHSACDPACPLLVIVPHVLFL